MFLCCHWNTLIMKNSGEEQRWNMLVAKQIAVKLCHSDCLYGQRTKNAGDVCCRCPPSRCHLFIKAFHQHMCGSVSQSLRRCRLFLWSFFSATVLFSRKRNKGGGTKQNQASDQPLFNKQVMTKIPQNCSDGIFPTDSWAF